MCVLKKAEADVAANHSNARAGVAASKTKSHASQPTAQGREAHSFRSCCDRLLLSLFFLLHLFLLSTADNKQSYFDGLGVSAAFLRDFAEEHRQAIEGLRTEQVCEKIVMTLTSKARCSYLQLLRSNPDAAVRSYVGKAIVFISHAWKYDFQDVLAVMLDHAEKNPNTFFWFDLFCNNQHEAPSYPFDWWSTTFKNNIESIGKVLLVLTPWNDPVPLKRAW
jgi:hypothetical protein